MGTPPAPGRVLGLRHRSARDRHRKAVRFLTLALLVGAIVCTAPLGVAKKKTITKTISGEVMDAAGNLVVGAAVELTDKNTGKVVAIYTEDGGAYQFAGLDPNHDYEIQAKNQDKSSEIRKVSSLDDRDVIVVNLRISAPEK